MRRGHTTENSVITAFHPVLLIGSQVNVLRHDERTRLDAITGNAAHDGLNVVEVVGVHQSHFLADAQQLHEVGV